MSKSNIKTPLSPIMESMLIILSGIHGDISKLDNVDNWQAAKRSVRNLLNLRDKTELLIGKIRFKKKDIASKRIKNKSTGKKRGNPQNLKHTAIKN